jgi:hypothetical protein
VCLLSSEACKTDSGLSLAAGCRTSGGGSDGSVVVAPWEEELDTRILLNLYVPLDSPGTYTVSVRRVLHVSLQTKSTFQSAGNHINSIIERHYTINLRRDPSALQRYFRHLEQRLRLDPAPPGEANSEAYALQYLKSVSVPFRWTVIRP